MTIYRVETWWQGPSLLPEDKFMNVLHFTDDNLLVAQPEQELVARMKRFWEDDGANVQQWISPLIPTGTDKGGILVYNLDDPEPRVPRWGGSLTKGASESNIGLPNEVAVVATLQAAQQAGSPSARRRGRMFLGPLCNAAATNVTGSEMRPGGTMREDFLDALTGLNEVSGPGGDENLWLAVYSRVDDVARRVILVSSDNAWDTQRRRGLPATSAIQRVMP